MSFLIGIDGGGTKSKAVLTDLQLNILAECRGNATNFLIKGTDEVSRTLLNLVKECLRQKQLSFNDLASIVLGTTGAGRPKDASRLKEEFLRLCNKENIPIRSFEVESDARVALEGAFGGKPGSILIAGTGSIMFGKDALGNIHRVGGFGRYIGDDGSGFTLGRKGLIAVAKSMDERGEETLLKKYVNDQFNIKTPNELITEVYSNNFDIPSVAPFVMKAAENGDEICKQILDVESDELILHLKAMQKRIAQHVLFVSLIGSLITKKNYYSELFRSKVKNQFTDVVIKEAEMQPELGAALMAKKYFISHTA